ncbi:MAG: PBP1A family penicillin-binding protein [Desulfuromonadales bacterium]|nr:PBP1A family penicillin-binding protein [Desulfuromonadales bacterium]
MSEPVAKKKSEKKPRLKRVLLIVALVGLFLAVTLPLGTYFYIAKNLPKVDTLADYRPPVVTKILSDDGAVIGELYKERRIVVPVSRMPKQLIQAFVAAEDSNFFKHQGIDLVSIARAAIKNIKAGGIVQGGSTITQQVAKSLLLTPERKFKRKFKEAILAYRMENRLSKEEILYLYLNQIYLGHRAHGVQAAAENYFDKDVQNLTLAECSILAGLPKAPSAYSPYRHFDRAKERQKYVLGRMLKEGFISKQELEQAQAEELVIKPRINQHITDAAYFTEQVRRYLEKTYGKETLETEGLTVHTSMSLPMQLAAQEAVQNNLRDHDKRRGYRAPLALLSEEEETAFLKEQAEKFAEKQPEPGALLEAVVSGSDNNGLLVKIGAQSGHIDFKSSEWAGPLLVVERTVAPTGNIVEKGAEVEEEIITRLPLGAKIQVRLQRLPELAPSEKKPTPKQPAKAKEPWLLTLEQEPLAQGALLAMDPHSGQIKVMVGGYDFRTSQFNRVLQARRLPGSAIKPLLYAAALDKGYTPASVILDTPVIYRERLEDGEIKEWKPKNYSKRFYGKVPMRKALAKSYNVITIKILEDIGVRYAANYVRKLGIESHLDEDLTLGLGTSGLTPMELARSYAVLANGGVRVMPTYINKIFDRDGKVLESNDPADFPEGPQVGQKLIAQPRSRVISPETAYLATNMMESVVQNGTGWRARKLKRPAAGKTGTTNDLKDAWFIGYIQQLLAVSWVGYDQERPLGKSETGSKVGAPPWVAFMLQAAVDMPVEHFPVPDSIEFRPIDPNSGLLAPEDSATATIEAFAPNTAPVRYAMEEKTQQAKDFFSLDLEGDSSPF